MSGIVPYVVLIGLLAALLLSWLRQDSETENLKIKAPSDPKQALRSLQLDLLTPATIDRLFALEDWEYVQANASPRVQRLFREERARIALLWLHQTRKHISYIMKFHLRAASRSKNLEAATELKLALSYITFLLGCGLLALLIRGTGPFCLRRSVGWAGALAQQVVWLWKRLSLDRSTEGA